MIGSSNQYYMLIGSLPALPPHFEDAERLPISNLQLNERLKLLAPSDAEVMEEMSNFLVWERQPLEQSNQDVVAHFERFIKTVDNRFTHQIITRVMTIRTVLCGLRSRRLGLEPPIGIEPAASQIARYWNHPTFKMEREFPWIADVDAQLNGERPFDYHREALNIRWQFVKRLSDEFFFSFEAVLLYVMRWEVVYRWTRRDAEAGRAKFERLVSEAMGDYADLFNRSATAESGGETEEGSAA